MEYPEWYRLERKKIVKLFGGCCMNCKTKENLQFAHIHPTPVYGKGRGSYIRLMDVIQHPFCYVLMCENCHRKMDSKMREVKWVHSFTD